MILISVKFLKSMFVLLNFSSDESDGDDIGDHYDARDKKKDKRMSRSPGTVTCQNKTHC